MPRQEPGNHANRRPSAHRASATVEASRPGPRPGWSQPVASLSNALVQRGADGSSDRDAVHAVARARAQAAGIQWEPTASNQRMCRRLDAATEDEGLTLAGRSSGRPLPPAVQLRMEAAFGRDLGPVRIHVDGQAAKAAETLNAHAFALGADLFFASGTFAPGTPRGDRLLAHELTHVVQHLEGRLPQVTPGGSRVSSPSDPVEQEAYANEERILARLPEVDHALADAGQGSIALATPDAGEQGASEHAAGETSILRDTTAGEDGVEKTYELLDPEKSGPMNKLWKLMSLELPKGESPVTLYLRPGKVEALIGSAAAGAKIGLKIGVDGGVEGDLKIFKAFAEVGGALEGSVTIGEGRGRDALEVQSVGLALEAGIAAGVEVAGEKYKWDIDKVELFHARMVHKDGEWVGEIGPSPELVEFFEDFCGFCQRLVDNPVEMLSDGWDWLADTERPGLAARQLDKRLEDEFGELNERAKDLGQAKRDFEGEGYTIANAHNLAVIQIDPRFGDDEGKRDEAIDEERYKADARQAEGEEMRDVWNTRFQYSGADKSEIEKARKALYEANAAPDYIIRLGGESDSRKDLKRKRIRGAVSVAEAVCAKADLDEEGAELDEEGKDTVAHWLGRAEAAAREGDFAEEKRCKGIAAKLRTREEVVVQNAKDRFEIALEKLKQNGVDRDRAIPLAEGVRDAWLERDEATREARVKRADWHVARAIEDVVRFRERHDDSWEGQADPSSAPEPEPVEAWEPPEEETADSDTAAAEGAPDVEPVPEAESPPSEEGGDEVQDEDSGEDVQQRSRGRRADAATTHQAAKDGLSGAAGALPHLSRIQESFGAHDVTGIQAHSGRAASEAAETMGAEAYASGNAVVFAGSPDLHLAAHEAAHVVQQRGGVSLPGGVGQAGDAYEVHADAVADAVVRGQDASALLDAMAPAEGAAGPEAIQREDLDGDGGDDEVDGESESEADSSGPEPADVKGDVVIEDGEAKPGDHRMDLYEPVSFANRDPQTRTIAWNRVELPPNEADQDLKDITLGPGAVDQRSFNSISSYPYFVQGEDLDDADQAVIHSGVDKPSIAMTDAAGQSHRADVNAAPGLAGGTVEGFCFLETAWSQSTPDYRGTVPLVGPFLGLVLGGSLETTGEVQLLVDGEVIREDNGTSFRIVGDASFGPKTELTVSGTLEAGVELSVIFQTVAAGLGGTITATTRGLKLGEQGGGRGATVDLEVSSGALHSSTAWSVNGTVLSDLDFTGDLWGWASTDGLFGKNYWKHDLIQDGEVGSLLSAPVMLNATGKRNKLESIEGLDVDQLITIGDVAMSAASLLPWP